MNQQGNRFESAHILTNATVILNRKLTMRFVISFREKNTKQKKVFQSV